MKRINVISSSIKSVGYNIDNQILEIEFSRGTIYQYRNVPSSQVMRLIFADSIGKYFHQNIKMNYEFRQIRVGE